MPLLVSLTSQTRHFILPLIGRKLDGKSCVTSASQYHFSQRLRSDSIWSWMLLKVSGLRAVRKWLRYFTSANRNPKKVNRRQLGHSIEVGVCVYSRKKGPPSDRNILGQDRNILRLGLLLRTLFSG